MRRALILLICLLPLACDDDGNGVTEPEPEVAVRLSPAQVSASPGTEFEMSIMLENSVDIFGLTFDVVFDSTAVGVGEGSVEFGDLFGETPLTLSIVEPGRISFGVSLSQTPGVDQVSGTGEVASISFTSFGAAQSEIRLQSVQAVDETGESTPVASGGPTTVN